MKYIVIILLCLLCSYAIYWAREKEKDEFAKKVADELEKRQKEDDK